MRYYYVAKDKIGKTVSGFLDASSETELIKELHQRDLLVISVRLESKRDRMINFRKGKVSLDELVIFLRQLATLIEAGIPLVQALSLLEEQLENRCLNQIILSVRKDIEAGVNLPDALTRHPEVFSSLIVNMVKAGEASGMLDEILQRLATYLEKTLSLLRKIRSGLVYPAVVVVMAILITIVLLLKVVPTFKGIFEMLGGKLPLPTLILIGISDFLLKYFFLFIIILIVVAFLFIRYINTERGRYNFDKRKLQLPVVGILFRKLAIARFCRTLSTLVKSGVNILNALEIVGKTSGNKVIEEAANKCRQAIKEGETISAPLSQTKVFPPMVCRMINVGEKTGQLENMLSKIADFYEEQVDTAVAALVSMIEPLVIVFLGVVVGGIVISLFMPVFKITELVGR
ncbi:MAG: type II secretion system F family protein [Candidatus Omnitrophica bacterium]|nr:type II secretion system F family protein [Candidatus Omnitrophota bacterium]